MKYFITALMLTIFSLTAFSRQTIQKAKAVTVLHFLGITKKISEVQDAIKDEDMPEKTKQHEDDERFQLAESKGSNTFHEDAALQKNYSAAEGGAKIKLLSNWKGNVCRFWRSDNNIAVGPNHVVQMINSNRTSSIIKIWNKNGDVIVNRAYMQSFTGIEDWGDPNIIYDEKADRYVISFLHSATENKLIVIASVTPDPSGAWYVYSFDTPGGFPDYEKISVWNDSYIITIAAGHPDVYVLNRDDILNGKGTGTVLMFQPKRLLGIGWQALSAPTETGSKKIPKNSPAVLMRVADDYWAPNIHRDHLELFFLRIKWNDPLLSTMEGPVNLPIQDYNSDLCGINANSCLPQKNSNVKLWPVSDFIMDKAQYRRFDNYESIVCSHVCNATGDGVAGVRWYELRNYDNKGWNIYQQSTYLPTLDNRFMSSITINDEGTIAMGYNITSENIYPGIRLTGRTACDTLNEMTATETTAQEGQSPNVTLNYGDYNSMVTDPVDGTFWFAAQWNKTPWFSTNVTHFKIMPCKKEAQQIHYAAGISAVKIFPSPANTQLIISFISNKNANETLHVFDLKGTQRISINASLVKGSNQISISTSSLPTGYYILRLGSFQNVRQMKFFVQH